MSEYLCISITFLDPFPSFHGRGDGELEWPPSPLRLFQALVAAAGRGMSLPIDADSIMALKLLEAAPPPIIVAPSIIQGAPIRIAVPNNDLDIVAAAWEARKEPKKQPNELKTMKTVRPGYLVGGEQVQFFFADDNEKLATQCKVFKALARSITHLGWGTDMVAAEASMTSADELHRANGKKWQPVHGAAKIESRSPTIGTLDDLTQRHHEFVSRLTRGDRGAIAYKPVSPQTSFRAVGYRRSDDPAPRPYAIFELRTDDDEFLRYPQDKFIHIAGMVRHLAIETAKLHPPSGFGEDWIDTYIAGHNRSKGDDHRQLSYVPLPSIGHAYTDPSIRRVMIVAPPGDDALLTFLALRLSGRVLKPEPGTRLGRGVTLVKVRSDNVARFYTCSANTWASATPVILPGHDDHKPAKTRRLIEKALLQSGIEIPCEFEWSPFSHFPKLLTAHKYDRDNRPAGFIRPDHLLNQTAVHLRLVFNENKEVSGPLVIGAGRHCGFGLMGACDT
jgi:CRISPR-associated protein Csb2